MKKYIIFIAVFAMLSLVAVSCKSEAQRLKEAEIEYYEQLLEQYKAEQQRLREVEELLYQAEYGTYSKGIPETTIDLDIVELEEKIKKLKEEL